MRPGNRHFERRAASGRAPERLGAVRGFTLGEMLIALVIVAMLLSAVAVAMKSAFQSYQENARIAEVTQASRVVLNRIAGEIRTADSVAWSSAEVSITPPTNPQGITGKRYVLSGGTLYYYETVSGVENSTVLIASDETVLVGSFVVSAATDPGGVIRSLTLHLNLRAGENPFYVTTSTCPRRNLTY